MMSGMDNVQAAEVILPSQDLAADLTFYTRELGFRLETIFPADDPGVAVLSGHGLRLRLERGAAVAPGVLRLLCRDPEAFAAGAQELTAPNGVRVQIVDAQPRLQTPPTQHAFLVRRLKDNCPWVIGRAGMHYRDLIPGRLGGSIIASHIRIPDAGPVPDMVHYHTVGFQLIFCIHGWVRLVYEDQGPPFVLNAGDCVIQPPQIRHRVLEASEDLQVIEIGVPAEHTTTVDHELELPTPHFNPEKVFGGQTFCRSEAGKAVWTPWRLPGFEARETGIGAATAGVASVRVARPARSADIAPAPVTTHHNADILFAFVLSGSVTLHGEGQDAHALTEGDAFVIPPHFKTALTEASEDLQLLEVSLPADFETALYPDDPDERTPGRR
jgi:quercetin dioxygenase-like cupin family protein/catechol 2,3-dioxygenase-like lactoylglutathione lyase family enzyme